MKNTGDIAERDRVRRHTSAEQLAQFEDQLEESIRFYSTQPDEVITQRIQALDQEWSIERWLDTNASTLATTGAVLGLTVNKKWLVLSGIVSGFLLQHALTGWCPPVPVFRRLGVRTRSEIDREKFALKALRGDFNNIDLPPREREVTVSQKTLESVTT